MSALNEQTLLRGVNINGVKLNAECLPETLVMHSHLGILSAMPVKGHLVYEAPEGGWLYETRATITPQGDYLLMFPSNAEEFPCGHCHYAEAKKGEKLNRMFAFRSKDGGRTWDEPSFPFDIGYNQHAFIPFVPCNSSRIFSFGTQPLQALCHTADGLAENAPIGYRYSDDDGYSWSEVRMIRPENDQGFTGMSAMRMCETDNGTWLIGSHEGDWSYKPLMTRQYILRSEDMGKSWQLVPGKRHGGWHATGFNRMDEGRPVNVGGGRIMLMARTPEGHLWNLWSDDDGNSWTEPQPTTLRHPDAPPMLFHLSDGKTLVAFHHNCSLGRDESHIESSSNRMARSSIWASISQDRGETWSPPRFVFANALEPDPQYNDWRNFQCSYIDAFADSGILHIFLPHRWHRCLHLTLKESDLLSLPLEDALL